MKLLEEKNHGWWHNHEQHISHYTGWIRNFRQDEREFDRKGYHDLAEQCRAEAESAKRDLQRVLTGTI